MGKKKAILGGNDDLGRLTRGLHTSDGRSKTLSLKLQSTETAGGKT